MTDIGQTVIKRILGAEGRHHLASAVLRSKTRGRITEDLDRSHAGSRKYGS
jgi:hypothetical protein